MTLLFHFSFVASSLLASVLAQRQSPPAFTARQLAKIRETAVTASTRSWEIGTKLEALLELETPSLSVFGATSVPVDPSSTNVTFPYDGKVAIDGVLSLRWPGLRPFIADGAAADPASIGVGNTILALLSGDNEYMSASESQIDHLLNHTPRASDNVTISHRQDEFQAWSDYMYMAPPFICYYGATVGGSDGAYLVSLAHAQAEGYRRILRDPQTNLWRHIKQGGWEDNGLWGTGNGWAAMGMLRVSECIRKSEYGWNMESEVMDLLQWTREILNATWIRQEDDGFVKNYFDTDAFRDGAATAILAASSYRYAKIARSEAFIPFAERAFRGLIKGVGDDGWLAPVTDPYKFSVLGKNSPEAQSFLIHLHAAAKDYYNSNNNRKAPPSNILVNEGRPCVQTQ